MPTYRVETDTEGREVYLVDAADPEEARARWAEGRLVLSEVLFAVPIRVEEEQ